MLDVSGFSALAQTKDANASGAQLAMMNAAAGKGGKMNAAQADQVAHDFESMFLSQMLEQMFGESMGDDMFGNSETEGVYKSLMVEQYGKQITKAGGIGIADYVKKELLKLQEIGT